MTEKIVVDGEQVWANPNYTLSGEPLPEMPMAQSSIQMTQAKITPAWRIAARLKLLPVIRDIEGTYVQNVHRFEDGRVMADVCMKGEWGRYVCTQAEIDAREGGVLVDAELEVAG